MIGQDPSSSHSSRVENWAARLLSQQNSSVSNRVWMVRRLCAYKKRLGAGLLFALLSGILPALDPLLLRQLIDFALPEHRLMLSLGLVLGITICFVGGVGFLLWSVYVNFTVQTDFSQQMRLLLLEQLNRLSATEHEQTPVGDTLSRLERDVDQIGESGSEVASASIRALILVVVNVAIMLQLNPTITLAIAPCLAAFAWVRTRFRSPLQMKAELAQSELGRSSSILCELLSSLPQIQLLCAENLVMRKAITTWTGMIHARTSQRKTELAYTLAVNALLSSATMMVLAVGSLQFVHGGLSIGGLVAFYAYSTRMFEPVSSMMQTCSQLHRVAASIARVRSVLEREPVVPDRGKITRGREALKTGISLENVSFHYSHGREGLRQVSLRIVPGERLGVVGPSGSGKSTLARLLVRFADPQSGRIVLDGHAIEKYSLATLRNVICYIPQHPVLLNGSVSENLRYGRPEATENELHQALTAAELNDLMARLPAGLNTRIGPAGHTLSGGERQRLALARALLRSAPILVLDESTSALDLTTEGKVLEGIRRYCAGVTLIIISHRVSSMTWVDRVAVFDSGRIVRCCPPHTLPPDESLS